MGKEKEFWKEMEFLQGLGFRPLTSILSLSQLGPTEPLVTGREPGGNINSLWMPALL